MLDELKQKSFKNSLPVTVLLLIIAVVITVIMSNKYLYAVKGYDDFKSLKPEEIKNQIVELDLDLNFGGFLESYTRNTSSGKTTTDYVYYVIWTGNEDDIDYVYMGIKVPASVVDAMDEMAEYTYNGYYSDPIHFYGEIKKMGSDELSYFRDYFSSSEWTSSEIDEWTIPYYIDARMGNSSTGRSLMFVCMAGTLLLYAWVVLRMVKGVNGGYMKKFTKDYETAGYVESSIASDYNRAEKDAEKETLRLGDLCLYWTSSTPRAIATKEICWAFKKTTTHRTNGIKTGTTYSVEIYQAHNKEHFSIPLKKEYEVDDILGKIETRYPWVFVGYGDELARTYNKNREEFLNIRYNKVDRTTADPYAGYNTSWDNNEFFSNDPMN